MVVVLAGRRVDAVKADTPRFPSANVALVRQRIHEWFVLNNVHTLVSSAACGADLLAVAVAQQLDIRTRIVLPFSRQRFRAVSVVDRGQEWGACFDAVIQRAERQGDVLNLGYMDDDESAYSKTNRALHDLAKVIAMQQGQTVKALLVWDGVSRGADDLTADFQKEALARALPVEEILTV